MSKYSLLFMAFAMLFVSQAGLAEAPVIGEPSLTTAFDDAQLQWGPCPEFIPKGCQIAVLHGDPAKENLDVFFKVPADFQIPSHWHTSAERMVLISGSMNVTYKGQPTQALRPGMYAYGPAKLPHSAECLKGDPCVLFIAFVSPLDAHPTEAGKH